jgi:hypothetical protein
VNPVGLKRNEGYKKKKELKVEIECVFQNNSILLMGTCPSLRAVMRLKKEEQTGLGLHKVKFIRDLANRSKVPGGSKIS